MAKGEWLEKSALFNETMSNNGWTKWCGPALDASLLCEPTVPLLRPTCT